MRLRQGAALSGAPTDVLPDAAALATAGATLAGLVLVLAFAERRKDAPMALRFALKATTSVGFLATALLSGVLDTSWGRWIFAGLVCSWWGDVLLLSQERRAFLAGLVAFLAGHVAYAVAFVVRGVDWLGGVAPALVVGLVGAALVTRWLLPKVAAAATPGGLDMRRPVLAYIVVITLMVALAGGTVAFAGRPLLLVGAVLFWFSDISVATDRFAGGGFGNRVWGLSFYYVAQLLLALSAGPHTLVTP